MNLKQIITLPRILGIILLATAALAYKTQGALRAALLAIAGLVLVLTPTESGKKHWDEFLNSLKLGKEFVLIMLYDILFWALLAVLTLILANVLRTPYEQLKLVQFGGESVSLGNLQAYNAIIENFFTATIIAIIVFWVLAILAYSLSRGLIWLTLLEKPAQQPYFMRLSLLNIVWCTVWVALAVFFMATMQQPIGAYVFLILLILYAHLTSVLHYSYTKMRAFGRAIKDAFGVGLGKLGRFAHAYCYLFVVYVILSQFQRIATGTSELLVTFIIFLVFMAWYRTYLRNILRHIA